MSEEFKYGTAENMSKTNYLRQGDLLVASFYLLTKSLEKDFNDILKEMLFIVQVYIKHWTSIVYWVTCKVFLKLNLY